MSKAMVIFILLASGSLYDPQRVLSQLGPEASAIGYKIKHAIPGIRASRKSAAISAPSCVTKGPICTCPSAAGR